MDSKPQAISLGVIFRKISEIFGKALAFKVFMVLVINKLNLRKVLKLRMEIINFPLSVTYMSSCFLLVKWALQMLRVVRMRGKCADFEFKS